MCRQTTPVQTGYAFVVAAASHPVWSRSWWRKKRGQEARGQLGRPKTCKSDAGADAVKRKFFDAFVRRQPETCGCRRLMSGGGGPHWAPDSVIRTDGLHRPIDSPSSRMPAWSRTGADDGRELPRRSSGPMAYRYCPCQGGPPAKTAGSSGVGLLHCSRSAGPTSSPSAIPFGLGGNRERGIVPGAGAGRLAEDRYIDFSAKLMRRSIPPPGGGQTPADPCFHSTHVRRASPPRFFFAQRRLRGIGLAIPAETRFAVVIDQLAGAMAAWRRRGYLGIPPRPMRSAVAKGVGHEEIGGRLVTAVDAQDAVGRADGGGDVLCFKHSDSN